MKITKSQLRQMIKEQLRESFGAEELGIAKDEHDRTYQEHANFLNKVGLAIEPIMGGDWFYDEEQWEDIGPPPTSLNDREEFIERVSTAVSELTGMLDPKQLEVDQNTLDFKLQ
tara:strand:+ start:184 stop:525 length:342 start_codon:yes stop_codon:yes gene_type:complete